MITEKQIKKNKRKQNKNKIKNKNTCGNDIPLSNGQGGYQRLQVFFYNMRLKKIKKMTIHIV